MITLKTPLTKENISKLKVGDKVLLNGTIFTARDMAHKFLCEDQSNEFKEKLKGSIIYHCGPIVKKESNEWKIISAGPTTSIREEPYEEKVIKDYNIKAIIGKGGMGEKTLNAMKEHNCIYLHATGGAAVLIADSIVKVKNVYKLEEFGIPEAVWELEVSNFPAIVTMDANRNSLHNEISALSKKNYKKLVV